MKPTESDMAFHRDLLKRVLDWRALDGDGISDPLRQEIIDTLKSSNCNLVEDENLDYESLRGESGDTLKIVETRKAEPRPCVEDRTEKEKQFDAMAYCLKKSWHDIDMIAPITSGLVAAGDNERPVDWLIEAAKRHEARKEK